MSTTAKTTSLSGRMKWITGASIAAVVAAGALAIGANFGILDAASTSKVGSLSAGDLSSAAASTTSAAASTAPQRFTVDTAGTVTLAATRTGLRVDAVVPTSGWTWATTQTQPNTLTVVFTNGTRTLRFTGIEAADHTINGTVDEPGVSTSAPANTTPASGGSDDNGRGPISGGKADD